MAPITEPDKPAPHPRKPDDNSAAFRPYIPAHAAPHELTPRALIVAQHGRLKYPEGTACAEVLKAGASRRVGSIDRDSKDEVGSQRSDQSLLTSTLRSSATEDGSAATAAGGGGLSGKAIFTGF